MTQTPEVLALVASVVHLVEEGVLNPQQALGLLDDTELTITDVHNLAVAGASWALKAAS